MEPYFGATDYSVFIGTLIISLSIGIFYAISDKNKRRSSPDDYFLAGRKSKTFPVTLSFVVTFQSSLLILANPVEVYSYGMTFCLFIVGLTLSYIVAAVFIVPVLYPLRITSVNKYFHLRYGDHLVRYLVVLTGVIYSIFYMGSVIYGTCVAAEVVIGIPYWVTVLLYSLVTTIYTSIGGIKAVVWTDVFQFMIMTLGIVAVLIKSTADAGGVSNVAKLARDRLIINEFSIDPRIRYTVWNTSFGSITMFLYLCVSQSGIQRISSIPNLRSARLVYILSTPFFAVLFVMASLEGVTTFAYYSSIGCDLLNTKIIENVNELLPYTVTKLFHDIPGINGLFIASLSSAALSTLSSCLSSLSAITYDDVIRVKFPDVEGEKATLLSKFTVLVYGTIGLVLTFIIAKLPGSILNIFLGFMACIDGPTSAIFILSVLFRRGTSKGVFSGGLCGMAVSFWLIVGRTMSSIPLDPKLPSGPTGKCSQYANVSKPNLDLTNMYETDLNLNITAVQSFDGDSSRTELTLLENIYTVSYTLYSLIGFCVTVIVSIGISYCTKPLNVEEKYLFSFSKHVMKDLLGRDSINRTAVKLETEMRTIEEGNELLKINDQE